MRNRMRTALIEMLVIGAVIGLSMCAVARHLDGATVFACFLTGLLTSPLAWGVYRLGRFVVLPRRR